MPDKRYPILNTYVNAISMDETITEVEKIIKEGKPTQHVVINALKVNLMNENAELRRIVNACPLINADGASIVWAAKKLGVGPFIWGKKASTHLIDITEKDGLVIIRMKCYETTGTHTRKIVFNQKNQIQINDDIEMHRGFLKFILSPQADVTMSRGFAVIEIDGRTIKLSNDGGEWEKDIGHYSIKYDRQEEVVSVGLHFNGITTSKVQWEG